MSRSCEESMDADLQDLLAELAAEAEPEPVTNKPTSARQDGEDWGGTNHCV